MRSIVVSCALVSVLSCIFPTLLSADPKDQFSQESVVFERFDTSYKMRADGTGERVLHILLRVQSQGTAQQFGMLSFGYASAYETPHIAFVRVLKPDGTTVDTPPDTAIDMPAEVTRQAPLYSDLKEKHIAVRSLSVGDKLEYEVHTSIDKAQAPGQFWGTLHFIAPGTIVTLAQTLQLEVPKDKYVQVWSPNHKAVIAEHGSTRTYTWNEAQLVPAPKAQPGDDAKAQTPKDPDEDKDGRKLPSVAWTTFHSWNEVGDWYRSMALSRAEPTDTLRSRANEIIRDAKQPEDQVRALYEFVSSKIRYIGIDFGVGRYQPHAAPEVLANQYGDCKDKDTLLESLLRSKGFVTAPALVGVGIVPVPDVPSPAMFNHVITTVELPSGRIWLDSTPGVAPFEYLLAAIRDQKALMVNTNGQAALVATPATAPYPFQERFEATGTLDAEGKLTAKMSATYHDDAEVLVRGLASSVAPAEWDKISQYISSAIGFSGTTSNSQFKNVQDASAPIAISYDYQKHPFGDWDNRRIIPLFPVLEFPALANDSAAPTDDIDLGAPRQLVAVTHIQIPEHYRTDLPDPIHVKTEFASFDQTYQFDGKQITVERTVAILQEKIAKQEWKKYQRFLKDISADSEPWIQLLAPVKPITIVEEQKPAADSKSPVITKEGKVTIVKVPTANSDTATKITPPPLAPAEDAPAAELMQKALEQMRTGDWTSAAGTLEAVKKKDAHQQFLWSALGTIAAMHRNFDEAKTDFRTELKNYPDNPMSVAGLADIEKHSGDSAAAQRTLKDYLNSHPDDLRLSMTLVSLQNEAGDYSAALKTLQTAADHHPEDQNVRVQLADTLFRLKQGEQAAAAAKSVLEDATDPLTMNNAAYVLAQTGHDLPFAETMSRKAVDLLEEKSAGITAAQANSNAFASGTLLVSAWDTLGWILYEEGKPEEALPLLQAAWRDSLRSEIGDHLGQTYEALKRNDNACAAYRLADAAANSSTPAEVRQHIHDAFTRLEKAGAKSGPLNGTQALQESRTYKLGHAEAVSGWGTFRIELSAEGVLEAQQMSGDRRIASVGDTIKKLKFSELIPPGSKAHLLRSAVVSCSQSSGCEVVLVPDGGLQTEQE